MLEDHEWHRLSWWLQLDVKFLLDAATAWQVQLHAVIKNLLRITNTRQPPAWLTLEIYPQERFNPRLISRPQGRNTEALQGCKEQDPSEFFRRYHSDWNKKQEKQLAEKVSTNQTIQICEKPPAAMESFTIKQINSPSVTWAEPPIIIPGICNRYTSQVGADAHNHKPLHINATWVYHDTYVSRCGLGMSMQGMTKQATIWIIRSSVWCLLAPKYTTVKT